MKELHIALAPPQLGELWGIPITSTLLTSWFVTAILLIGAYFIGRSLRMVPGKGQVAVEGVISFGLNYMEGILEDKALARKYFPLIMSIFFFILCANLVSLLPFVGPIGVHGAHGEFIPLFYSVNTDFNVTFALAVIAFIAIEFAGITVLGALKYFHKFVNFSSVIGFVVGIIELISELARLITFSFRLFGNIFAGKVLILIALYFAPLLLPVPLLAYEVFVGVIQAAVFSLLTLFFIKMAITEQHH